MEKIFFYNIDSDASGMTANLYLRHIGYSRKMITALRHGQNRLLINGEASFTNRSLTAGDTLEVRILERDSDLTPTKMNLTIVYEDEDLIVIDKPAGLPVHPSQGHFQDTLANGLTCYFQEQGKPCIIRTINRLDRDTTGLVLVARHQLSAAILYQMVKDRNIKREYLAISRGVAPESGTIYAPIARIEGSILERQVDFENGETAITHYQRIYHDDIHSLLRLQLETGKTHQIRVHMKHLGVPLIGDFLYNPDFDYMKRQGLHSSRLSFPHPIKKELLSFQSPLPADMKRVFPDYKD